MVGLGGSAGSIRGAAGVLHARCRPTAGMVFVVILHLSPEHESDPGRAARPLDDDAGACRPQRRAEGRAEPRLRHPAGQVPGVGRRPPAADRPGSRPRPARRGRPVLPHAGRHARAARGGDRAVGRRRRRRDRHQAHQGARRADDRAGPGRGRASRDAAHGDRHRHGRLGAAGRARCRRGCIEYREHRRQAASCRPRTGRSRPKPAPAAGRRREAALRDVLAFLRTRTGRDFCYYKRATILRRIARRMQVNGVERPAGLPRLPAHAPRRGRRAAAGPADLRHQLLPRPRRVRGARAAHARAVRRTRARATRCASGCRRAPPARRRTRSRCCCCEHARTLDAPPRIQVFATRPRRRGDPRGARRALSRDDRGRRVARSGCGGSSSRSTAATGCGASCARWCSSPRTTCSRTRRSRASTCLLPQPADLPEPRRAAAGARDLPLRAAAATACCSSASSESVDDGSATVPRRSTRSTGILRSAAGVARAAAGAARGRARWRGRSRPQERSAAPVVHGRAVRARDAGATSTRPAAAALDRALAGASCTSS